MQAIIASLPKPASSMTTADIMRHAHAITKAVKKAGDSYQATFGLALRLVYRLIRREASKLSTLNAFILGFAGFIVLYALGFTGEALSEQAFGMAGVFSGLTIVASVCGMMVANKDKQAGVNQ